MTTATPSPAAPMPGPPLSGAPAPRPKARPTDWTEEVSIFQPRQAAFWLFAALLLIGGISFVDEQLRFANVSTTAWLVGMVLLALYAVPVFVLVNTLDLFEREPRSLLIGALLWGAIVATFLAGRINDEWASIIQKLFGADFARTWAAALVGPGDEELLKFLGVVVIYLIARAEFDDVLDGFVYGAMVGLGFTLAEDMYYFFSHFVGQAGASNLGGLCEGLFIRVIVGGPYSHVLLTGLTGMGLAYYVTRPDVARQRRLLVAIVLYAAGVAAHFVWNSPLFEGILGDNPGPTEWFVWAAARGLPFLILLGVLVRVAMRREQRWVREALADDLATGAVSAQELETLEDLRKRRAARKAVRGRMGVAGERLVARLQHAQIALAVAATGSEADRDARLAAGRELIAGIRARLATISGQPGAIPPTPFVPTHRTPPEGLPSWSVPDSAGPSTPLAPGLELEVVARAADWAQVRASSGWTGFVDARRLVARS